MPKPKTPRHRLREAWSWLLNVDGPLGHRAARGGIWLVAADLFTRFAGLIRMIILSRLLSSDDFGLLGIALMIQAWTEAFTQTGIQASLIHHKGRVEPLLDSAWTLGVLRGIGLFAFLVALSPLAAGFFEDPRIAAVLIGTAVVPLCWSFANPWIVSLRRDLDFRREMIYKSWGTAVGLVVAIALGFALRNVWALVFSLIASRLAEVIGSYWIRPYRPRLRLKREEIGQLFGFGKWVFWVYLLNHAQRQLDGLVVGKILGTRELGFYQVSSQLVRTPLEAVGMHASGVLFPAFSRVDDGRTSLGVRRVMRVLAAGLIPAAVGFSLHSHSIVAVILGPSWSPVGSIAAILVWMGVLEVLVAPARSGCMAIGKPNLLLAPTILRLIVIVAGLSLLLPAYGTLGAAWACLVAGIVWFTAVMTAVCKAALLTPRDIFSLPGRGLLAAAPLLMLRSLTGDELGLWAAIAWIGATVLASMGGAFFCRRDLLPYLTGRPSN